MHSTKNLFCNVTQICNLVQEFNGLVSKGVNRKIGPFYVQIHSIFIFLTPDNLFVFTSNIPGKKNAYIRVLTNSCCDCNSTFNQ